MKYLYEGEISSWYYLKCSQVHSVHKENGKKIESWGLWVDTIYFMLLLHEKKAVILLSTLA